MKPTEATGAQASTADQATQASTTQAHSETPGLWSFVHMAMPDSDITEEDAAMMRKASENAAYVLDCGLEEIGNLLMHVGLYEPNEFSTESLKHIGLLIADMAKTRSLLAETVKVRGRG